MRRGLRKREARGGGSERERDRVDFKNAKRSSQFYIINLEIVF